MKTFVNQIEIASADRCTLVLDNKTNEVLEVKYVKSIINPDGDIHHVFTHRGASVVVTQGSNEFKMFETRETFECDKTIPNGGLSIAQEYRRMQNHEHFFVHDNLDGSVTLTAITFINNIPVEVDAPIVSFEQDTCRRIHPVFDESVDIDNYFDSVEHAIAFNSYRIQKDDGAEEVVEGKYAYLLLTDEQQKIVDVAREALQKAKDLGVMFFNDTTNDHVYAFNGNKAKMNWDKEEGFNFQVDLPLSHELPSIWITSTDDDYFSIIKTEEQQ